MDVGAELKNYLKENKLSVPKVAAILDIPKDRIYKWLKGTRPSDNEDYKKLERLLENVPRGTVGVEMESTGVMKPTKTEEITALKAAVKVLTLEIVQLKHQVTKESATKISLEIERTMQLVASQLLGEV